MKITFIYTTFPLLSESFLQREVTAMRDLGVELELFSLFRGKERFEGIPVQRFRWWHWAKLPFAFGREAWRYPGAFGRLARQVIKHRPAQGLNVIENFLGFAFAVVWAPHFRRTGRHHIHAAWATAPAAAALVLHEITGARFTIGAHAYDLFRYGGDWLLENKLAAASLVHTSTLAGRAELLRRGADAEKVCMIRRGLNGLPEMNAIRRVFRDEPIRLLSVGRLIEKKGFDSFLRICALLRGEGVHFECRIIGGGPLKKKLLGMRRALGLDDCIQFPGALPYSEVSAAYRWADLFCFTGRIAGNNDRDGLPNVVAEAMAYGIPVLSSSIPGAMEAITDGVTGRLLDPGKPGAWVDVIRSLRENPRAREALRASGRAWVEAEFDAGRNAGRLLEAFAVMEGREAVSGPASQSRLLS